MNGAVSQGLGRAYAILACAMLMTAVVCVGLRPHLINHDVAQFMYGGRAMLAGTTLYRDFVEMNLPTTYYAAAVPVLLAQATGIHVASALLVMVMAAVALSVALCAVVLDRAGLDHRGEMLLLVLAAELLPAFRHFGQREHLYAILTLPYVLSFLIEPRPLRRTAAMDGMVGVVAGLGLCLKVHFFVLPLFLEVAMLGRRRWGHGQSRVAVACGGVLLAAALWRHPEYVRDLVPLARATYGGWEQAPLALLLNERVAFCLLVLVLAAWQAAIPGRQSLRLVLAAASAAGLAAAAMQAKGYDYHLLPAMIPAAALLVVLAGDLSRTGRWPRTAVAMTAAMLLMGWGVTRVVEEAVHPFNYNATIDKMAPLVAEYGEGRPIALLSIHNFPAFPYLMRHGGEWALRYPSLWPLVGYYRAGAPVPPGTHVQALRRMVVDDLVARQPCLIVIDTWAWGWRHYPFADFLSQDLRFAALWQNYRLVGTVDGYDFHSRCGLSRHIP